MNFEPVDGERIARDGPYAYRKAWGSLVAAAQKIFEYLTSHVPESYCDNCLDEEIGLGIPPAVVIIPLMTTGLFTRELGECAKCRETKTVTHANRT